MKKLLKIGIITMILAAVIYAIYFHFKVTKNQSREISREYAAQASFKRDNLQDLPLLRFETPKSSVDYFIVLFPGDGGWRDFIDYLSNYISGNGINVVGFNTIPYFNQTRTPKEIASDVQRVMSNFSEVWGKKKVILAGYSFGAEILPFVYSNMEGTFRNKVACLALIAPSNLADFKVSPIYYYNPTKGKPVADEISHSKATKTLVFCDKQKNSLCNFVHGNDSIDIVQLNYGHMFTGKYKEASALIMASIIMETE